MKKTAQMQFYSSALAGRRMSQCHSSAESRWEVIRSHLISQIKDDIGLILNQFSRFTYLISKKASKEPGFKEQKVT